MRGCSPTAMHEALEELKKAVAAGDEDDDPAA